jgi:hypothetical protein
MPIHIIILAAVAGWTVDDFCGTPPRPWPRPGPGPWWLRKVLAAIGGGVAWIAFNAGTVSERPDLVGAVLVGGVGGAFLASLVGGAMGAGAAVETNVRG